MDVRAVPFYQAHGFIKLSESMRLILPWRTIADLNRDTVQPRDLRCANSATFAEDKWVNNALYFRNAPNPMRTWIVLIPGFGVLIPAFEMC